jgi:hypothetical protein
LQAEDELRYSVVGGGRLAGNMMSNFGTFLGARRRRPAARASSALPLLAMTIVATLSSQIAVADEGGVSFWLPGTYGSLAAAPGQPGFSFATINYFASASAGKNVDFQLGGGVVAGLNAHFDAQFFSETYVFATPVLGGQFSLGMSELVGRNDTSVSGTFTGPLGRMISGARSDSATGFGDLYPVAAIRWNQGLNNFMTYLTGDIPVGLYNSQNLANLGIGHGAIDSGGGYTYFNPQTGNELSAVIGATYNFMNTSTNYQNGVDGHLDWGASHFFTANFSLGAVGYVYQQLTADSGSGDRVGPFTSRVIGIGPQMTFLFPVAGMQGYFNVKGYKEFDAQDRASGYNLWLTLSISPEAPRPAAVVAKY